VQKKRVKNKDERCHKDLIFKRDGAASVDNGEFIKHMRRDFSDRLIAAGLINKCDKIIIVCRNILSLQRAVRYRSQDRKAGW
jgi:hypothetical protein